MVASPKEFGPEKDFAGKVQQHIQKKGLSSRQRGRPTKTRPQLSISGHESQMGLDTKTYCLTDRKSQLTFTLKYSSVGRELPFREDLRPEAENYPLLKPVTRKRLVKTLRAGKDLA
jgi:hypothetical protein